CHFTGGILAPKEMSDMEKLEEPFNVAADEHEEWSE
ncbi:unnamed protein product, partial [marine sediment metagenome]